MKFFGDPAYDKWKVLRVTKGGKIVELLEDVFNNGGSVDKKYDLTEISS